MFHILREFYQAYGVPTEGPPDNSSNRNFIKEHFSDGTDDDLKLLDNLNRNNKIKQKSQELRNLVDEIANCSSTSTQLLNDLYLCKNKINFEYQRLLSGILWYNQACELDPRNEGRIIPSANMEIMVSEGLSHQWVLAQQVIGASVIKMYIALVYLRGEWIREIFKIANIKGSKAINRYDSLFHHNVVRHLRNALAHGHIQPSIAGLRFQDRDFEAIITPGTMNLLCFWIFLFHFSLYMVYIKQ
jgi:hypothetical protein